MREIIWGAIFVILVLGCTACAVVNPDGKNEAAIEYLSPDLIKETDSGRMWQVQRSERFESYEAAQEYVRKLRLGGYSDWRIPTIMEMYNLYLLFDLKKNGNVSLELQGSYWSDDNLMGVSGNWDFGGLCCDPQREFSPKQKGYVRAVRP